MWLYLLDILILHVVCVHCPTHERLTFIGYFRSVLEIIIQFCIVILLYCTDLGNVPEISLFLEWVTFNLVVK